MAGFGHSLAGPVPRASGGPAGPLPGRRGAIRAATSRDRHPPAVAEAHRLTTETSARAWSAELTDLAPVTVGKRAPVRSRRLDGRAQGVEVRCARGRVDHKGDDGESCENRRLPDYRQRVLSFPRLIRHEFVFTWIGSHKG